MTKETTPAEYVVTVPGEGTFTFNRRTMRRQAAIECEHCRLTEGVPLISDFLGRLAGAMADLKVLTVAAPDGWNPEELDGFDEADYQRLMTVWGALRDKETSFRHPVGDAPKGEGASPELRAVVPSDVPSAAE